MLWYQFGTHNDTDELNMMCYNQVPSFGDARDVLVYRTVCWSYFEVVRGHELWRSQVHSYHHIAANAHNYKGNFSSFDDFDF